MSFAPMPTTISIWDHPIETLEKALHIRKQIEALKSSLAAFYGDGARRLTRGTAAPVAHVAKRRGRPPKNVSVVTVPAKVDGRKGKRSAAARARMAAAQKARWAKKRGVATSIATPTIKSPTKKRRTMSPEGRARIAAAQKARWAKVKG